MTVSNDKSVLERAQASLVAGKPVQAIDAAAGIGPKSEVFVPARWLMAVASMQSGDFEGALKCVDEVLNRDRKSAAGYNLRGAALAQLQRRDEAEAAFGRAHRLKPDAPDIAQNLGMVQAENGRIKESFATLEPLWRAGKLSLPAAVKLGTVALFMGETALAQDIVRKLQPGHAANVDVMNLASRVKQTIGDIAEAQSLLDAALEIDPNHADSLADKGILAMMDGETESAATYFDQVIENRPGHTAAQFMRAQMGGSGEKNLDDSVKQDRQRRLDAILEALQDRSLPYLERVELNYAAGKILDSLKRYDDCFPYYAEANRMLADRYEFKIAESRKIFADIKKQFGRSYFETAWPRLTASRENKGGNLIFIVGLARSGTTLTEQILARHPRIVAGGESNDAVRLGVRLGELTCQTTLYPSFLGKLSASDLDTVAAEYLWRVREVCGEGNYRTDKDLRNFAHLALIVTLFPEAKIVHVRRNPLDTCVSCFFQYFKIYKHQYSASLSDLGSYYRLYDDLMKHWFEVMPKEILSIGYEELVADQRGTVERILDHCGLPWDDACMKARESGSVKTASVWQVRQSLYKDSQDRWRRYERHLGPLIEALGDLADTEARNS